MKLKGIKRGQFIELLEQIDTIPDGTEITVELELNAVSIRKTSPEEARLTNLNRLFGVWNAQPELAEVFAQIDQERHTDQGRAIDPLEN